MSDATAIQWTDSTWNVVTGCTRVSPGCARCYIERTPPFRMAGRRFEAIGGAATTGVTFHRDRLEIPMRWRKPRRIFTCSLGDLFHEGVDEGNIRDAFTTMARARQHTFQVLTKRPERALRLFERGVLVSRWVTEWPLPNVWIGTSIENARYTWRADVLREIPAAVRFISAEPLLGSLFPKLDPEQTSDVVETHGRRECGRCGAYMETNQWQCANARCDRRLRRAPLDLSGIDWVIVGGESGPGARPFHLEHAREIIHAAACPGCLGDPDVDEDVREAGRVPVPALGAGWATPRRVTASTPLQGTNTCDGCGGTGHRPAVFVKQLGAKPIYRSLLGGDADTDLVLRDRKGGDWTEWPADLRIREFPAQAVVA